MPDAHALACSISGAITRFNRSAYTVLAFPVACAAVIYAGAEAGQLQVTLLALTTALSVDASWTARLVMMRQAQDAGEPV